MSYRLTNKLFVLWRHSKKPVSTRSSLALISEHIHKPSHFSTKSNWKMFKKQIFIHGHSKISRFWNIFSHFFRRRWWWFWGRMPFGMCFGVKKRFHVQWEIESKENGYVFIKKGCPGDWLRFHKTDSSFEEIFVDRAKKNVCGTKKIFNRRSAKI